ncbi:unnamed protein product [Cylicocyclus nassatus]|uniref:Uncharacterized protein n=1 Tax=Cylicocyclus nassatus TaxID=53992 RepID=A0AA36GQ88_CYLNA|nr:unnamed protein product [Cylicocyclus nassatus]
MEAKEVNNKKDGWYDKSQTRSLVGFKCIVVLLFLSAITPAYGQYLSDKGVYQQQPMLVQPIRCDCRHSASQTLLHTPGTSFFFSFHFSINTALLNRTVMATTTTPARTQLRPRRMH